MTLTKQDARKALADALKTACDRVTDGVAVPEVEAEKNNEFPYLCVIDDRQTYDENQLQVSDYRIFVLGYVRGDLEDLQEKLDVLEDKVFWAVRGAEKIRARVEEINNRNVYAPWGLTAGVFFPYAAFRMDVRVPYVRREEDEMVDWAALDARYVKKAGDIMTGALGFGTSVGWTIAADGDNLVLKFNGVAKLRYDPSTGKFETILRVEAEGGFDDTEPFVP